MTSRTILAAALAAVLVMGAAHGAWAFGLMGGLFGKYETVEAEGPWVDIPKADVAGGEARYYRFEQDGKEIKFFVVTDRAGQVRAALDACDVCWAEGKGYSQSGEFMICNNCGQRFHITRINEVKGGCNPAPLHRTFTDDSLRLSVAELVAGAPYFPVNR